MSLIRWTPMFNMEPFEEFDTFFEGFGKHLGRSRVPEVDVYEKDNTMFVEIPLAGVDPDKVDISLDGDVLTVKGSMERKSEVEDKDYMRREIHRGSFHRTVRLPAFGSSEATSAVFENGLLKVAVPKIEPQGAKKIPVHIKK